MDYQPHVGLVDAHTEGIGGNHHAHIVGCPLPLAEVFLGIVEPGMVERCADALLHQRVGHLTGALSAAGIDNGRAALTAQDVEQLLALVADMASFPEIEPILSWGSRATSPAALVGGACASAIVTNAIVPFMAAFHPRKAREIYGALPPETVSSPMRLMASRIFGRDHNPRLYAGSGLLQQGLIQIFNDFCLQCKSDCADCAFAKR